MLATLADSVPQVIPREALVGRLADISDATEAQGYTFSVYMSGLTYQANVARAAIKAYRKRLFQGVHLRQHRVRQPPLPHQLVEEREGGEGHEAADPAGADRADGRGAEAFRIGALGIDPALGERPSRLHAADQCAR